MTKPDTPILIRSVLAYIVAHVIIARGRNVTLEFLLQEEFYWMVMFSSFGTSLLTWSFINWITRHFDTKYDWIKKPLERFILQTLGSIITPVCLMTTMIGLQFFLLHGDASLDASNILNDLLVCGYFVLFINLLYFSRYMIQRLRETRKVLERDFPYYSNFGL
jgi:hypothetical protein